MKLRRPSLSRTTLGYAGVLAASYLIAMVAGWTRVGAQIDNYAYDFLFSLNPPAPMRTQAVIVGVDDATFQRFGGVRNERGILARALERIAAAGPKVVAVDIILSDAQDPPEDEHLARAFAQVKNLVLATDLTAGGWEDPQPAFARTAAALGHVYADEVSEDGVTRMVSLEKTGYRKRRWALSLEAFRLARDKRYIVESLRDLEVGDEIIPAHYGNGRPLRIVYAREAIPQISAADLLSSDSLAAKLHDKVIFLGVTSQSYTRDRVKTPYGGPLEIPGVEVHAQTFETLERARFLVDASNLSTPLVCGVIAILAGCIFAWFAGWPAYLLGAALLAAAHSAPFLLFRHGIVFPYFAPLATAWLTVVGAASYQSFVVRRQLRQSEVERARYRQAIHFVTHEMRSPLTAIQGSSELMGRYNLNEDKRKQIATMINSESKRLARMIQTFLDVERLADGKMELKREPVEIASMVQACVDRAGPLAERKAIRLTVTEPLEGELSGDRELMEYAVYNLLTNAIKYSPAETETVISAQADSSTVRLSIKDQGMGMDSHELKQIFTRFYRTRRAEASGESGTGIGLSIVDQIVSHHGGRMEVTSSPGKGSCFTVVLPVASATEARRVAR